MYLTRNFLWNEQKEEKKHEKKTRSFSNEATRERERKKNTISTANMRGWISWNNIIYRSMLMCLREFTRYPMNYTYITKYDEIFNTFAIETHTHSLFIWFYHHGQYTRRCEPIDQKGCNAIVPIPTTIVRYKENRGRILCEFLYMIW